jgi:hypothetical protein
MKSHGLTIDSTMGAREKPKMGCGRIYVGVMEGGGRGEGGGGRGGEGRRSERMCCFTIHTINQAIKQSMNE